MPDLMGLDLETGDARSRFTTPRGEYVKLVGLGNEVTTDPIHVAHRVRYTDDILVGHNILGFDLPVLDHHHGLRIEESVGRARDTFLQAVLADPPTSRETQSGPGFKSYSLDAVAQRVLGRPKDERGKALAKEFKGWDNIPASDPRFQAYCLDDVQLAVELHRALPWTPYMEREMRVQAIMSRMTLNGFRVDEEELDRRIEGARVRKENNLKILNILYGVPLEGKSPLASKAGKQALVAALERLGAHGYPRTATGAIKASREGMAEVKEAYGSFPGVATLCDLVTSVTSERTIYDTIKKHTIRGRVHPSIWPSQASGRWSVTDPGLTVVGKRGSLAVERGVFLPEPGEKIIAVDLGQVDARVVAAHSQDPAYIELFGPGRDVHTEVAVAMMGDAKYRDKCKPISHMANYGGGQSRLIAQGHDPRLVKTYFAMRQEKFPILIEWQDRVRAIGEVGGFLDNGFGRPMRVEPQFSYTQSPAQIGQGGTRDLMAEGLLDLADRAPEILPMLRTIVHDEIVLSVPERDVEEVSRVVVGCMERDWAPNGADIPVHIVADCSGPGTTWSDAYEN